MTAWRTALLIAITATAAAAAEDLPQQLSLPEAIALALRKNPDVGAVRERFGQWILDTARAAYDQEWLDYQHEIALRHHRTKKNVTDDAASTDIVPLRYLFPVIYPVTATLKPFLAKKGHSAEDVEKMHAAWVKSCLLQLTLWSYPYVKEGDF